MHIEPAWIGTAFGIAVAIGGGIWTLARQEARNAGYGPRLDAHDITLKDLEHRLTRIEAVRPEVDHHG